MYPTEQAVCTTEIPHSSFRIHLLRRYTDLSHKPIYPKARRMERHVPAFLIILTRRCTDFFDKAELSKGGVGWNVTFPRFLPRGGRVADV